MSKFLLLASELYSLPILLPVAEAASAAGHEVAWLCRDEIAPHLPVDGARMVDGPALSRFDADATFATVHRIPPQLPGRHVQLFHGLNLDKRDASKGHFRIRGLFDLYCTHGPATTPRFEALAREHGDFAVAETGWPKLDPLFAGVEPRLASAWRAEAGGRPIVMFASTFTTSLSAAAGFLPELRRLAARGDRHWLVTLHPKSEPALIEAYRALSGPNLRFFEAPRLLDALRAADVLVCDTSSVIEEFALLDKPIVTIRTRVPRGFTIDVGSPDEVDAAIDKALSRPDAMMKALREYAAWLHPLRDGHASRRVLEATERLLSGGYGHLGSRHASWWRRWKARRAMHEFLPAS